MNDFFARIGIDDAPEIWRVNYDAAKASYPEKGPEFLNQKYLYDANELIRLDADKFDFLLRSAEFFRKSEDRSLFVWLWYRCVVMTDNGEKPNVANWPVPENFGEYSAMPHAFVLLGMLPRLKEFYREKSITTDVLAETVSDMNVNMDEHKSKYGYYGVGAFRYDWLKNHFTGKLFSLGRLQFMHDYFTEQSNALTVGDGYLQVHIPGGGPMTREACLESYDRAPPFYKKHFPELEIKAFTCVSWLLSPDIAALLPPGSNIVRFQNDYTIYEFYDNCYKEVIENVFGSSAARYEDLPEDTSLRRAVKARMLSGGKIRSGAGYKLI